MQNYPTKTDNVSTEPSAEYNNLASELKEVVEASLGLTLNAGSINQLSEAITTFSQQGQYCTDGGTPNTYVLTDSPVTRTSPTAYRSGQRLRYLPSNTNTGASTASYAGLGALSIVLNDGSTALSGGEIVANRECQLWYDGTNLRLETINAATFGLSWEYDSAWFTANDTTLYTKAHGISLTFPANTLEIVMMWRVNSGGGYIMDCSKSNEVNQSPHLSHDGTNIYIKNIGGWGWYTDSVGTIAKGNNGEIRLLARKII